MKRFVRYTILVLLMQALVCTVCLHAFAEERYVQGELLVRFEPSASRTAVSSVNEQVGCRVIRAAGAARSKNNIHQVITRTHRRLVSMPGYTATANAH